MLYLLLRAPDASAVSGQQQELTVTAGNPRSIRAPQQLAHPGQMDHITVQLSTKAVKRQNGLDETLNFRITNPACKY